MINYFIYRISTHYDGFTPSEIPARTKNKRFIYNWTTYFDSVDVGDIILTYFTGRCKRGIYAVTRVRRFNEKENLVIADIIASSVNNNLPLISQEEFDQTLSDVFRSRARGAELLVPQKKEREIFDILLSNSEISKAVGKGHITLPGSPDLPGYDITQVPPVKVEQLSNKIIEKDILSGFWVRPKQSTWIKNCPDWVSDFTSAFSKFKGGDLSNINEFADVLEDKIRKKYKKLNGIAAITSVPLSNEKKKDGHIDRVKELSTVLASRLDQEYKPLFNLQGDISRRLYKNNGRSVDDFQTEYRKSLIISQKSFLKSLSKENKTLLLIDDVFTDGVTTETIKNICREQKGCTNLNIEVVTLGIMIKKNNISDKFSEELEL